MLPDHDRVFVEVADVGSADPLGILLHDHPANVAIQEPFANTIRVLLRVCVSMMSSVVTAPPADRSLDGTATHGSEENFEYGSGRIGLMSPQAMIAGSNPKTSPKVVYDSPYDGWTL